MCGKRATKSSKGESVKGRYMQEFITGFGWLILYFAVCASAALLIRCTGKLPNEVFRKLLHLILLGSLAVWVAVFDNWWMTALSAVGFAIVVYPILKFAERWKGYSKFVNERKGGELKSSLLVVFFMFAVVVTVCWGFWDDKLLALACVYAWGFGDGAAALVGKRFGRHKIKKIAGGKKSVEGTATMFAVSLCCVLAILWLRGGLTPIGWFMTSVSVAAVSAATELITPDGMDTVTCPFAAMVVMVPLMYLFGGLV